MRIDPALAERLEAVLRRRAESWAAEHAKLREVFGDDVPSRANPFPVELSELSPEEQAELVVTVLWPPAPPSRRNARRRLRLRWLRSMPRSWPTRRRDHADG